MTIGCAERSAEIRRLRQRIDWLEGTAIPHARRQENANGFQKGWHAALSRISEGDGVDDLAAVVPQPCADVDDTLPWPSSSPAPTGSATAGLRKVDEGPPVQQIIRELVEARTAMLAGSTDPKAAFPPARYIEEAHAYDVQIAVLRKYADRLSPATLARVENKTVLKEIATELRARLQWRDESGVERCDACQYPIAQHAPSCWLERLLSTEVGALARVEGEREKSSEVAIAAQQAVDFLRACEWNDRTSENDATNIAERLEVALLAAQASQSERA